MSDVKPGGRLGKYEIRGTLGRGAMGTVYDGWDPAIDRRVAIKTVRLPGAQDAEAREALARFQREAQAAGRLTHPNIVGVFDYGETDELAFIVMEFVDGRTLKDALSGDERLPLAEAVRLMTDILAGLAYSHGRGVVHRDIKPANIMLTAAGQAKIADFGIARIESSSMTQAGTVLGTPAYMSPEQFMGQTVDRRTDIYSAGVLLYQLLTGERPFEGSLTAIMHKALNSVPPKPSELSVTAPPGLDAVVARAMSRRPEDRYGDAAAFAQAMRDGVAADAEEATMVVRPAAPPPAAAHPAAPVKTASRLPLLAGGGVVLAVIAGAAAWVLTRPATEALAPAPMAVASVPGPVALPPPPTTPAPPAVAEAPPASLPAPAVVAPVVASVPALPEPAAQIASVVAPPPPPPPPSASAIRAALAAALPGLPCTLVSADVDDAGTTAVSGLAGLNGPNAALHRAVAAASATVASWRVATFDGPYCHALDVLRPVAARAAPLGNRLTLALADGRPALRDNEVMALGVALPDFAAHLQVDYFQHDGTVAHLVPAAAYPDRAYPADGHVELGRPRPGFPGWQVGPPFGTDMVAAIASSAPLFARPRPEAEPAEAYLRDLQAAMEALRRRGGSLTADAVVLETRP